MFGQAGHVEVGALDSLAAGPGEGDLRVEVGHTSPEKRRLTFIVLFCNLNPLRVWIALEASSCL